MKPQEILVYFSVVHHGDWKKIYDAISNKVQVKKEEVDEALSKIKSKYITVLDPEYPDSLKKGYEPPFVLFYKGNINLLKSEKIIAVVGSRKATDYGKRVTSEAVKTLLKDGYTIVSGLAEGIDTVALAEALPYGKGIAFLGNSLDHFYPSNNYNLQNAMFDKCLVCSEYPDGVGPSKDNFPVRNRLITNVSQAVLVGEAYQRSGTLITVGFALEGGKDIFCFPYPAGVHSSCNSLIKEGATLVENGNDIIYHLQKNY